MCCVTGEILSTDFSIRPDIYWSRSYKTSMLNSAQLSMKLKPLINIKRAKINGIVMFEPLNLIIWRLAVTLANYSTCLLEPCITVEMALFPQYDNIPLQYIALFKAVKTEICDTFLISGQLINC